MAKAQKTILDALAEGLDKVLLRWVTDSGKPLLDRYGRAVCDKGGNMVMRPLKACDVSVILSRLRMCGVTEQTSALKELEVLRCIADLKLTDDPFPATVDEAG